MPTLANIHDLAPELSSAARRGAEPPIGRWIAGRIVAVLASPELGNATDLALGVSVLNPGTSTPHHSHRSEEIAIIIAGSGTIELGDESVPVKQGDIIRTAPNVTHQTRADDGESQLEVLWLYAPAGSEDRWLSSAPEE